MATVRNWEQHYQTGKEALPLDTGEPVEELTKYFAGFSVMPKTALEIGCGTGTNAIWMAQEGVRVTSTDVSPTVIKIAKEKSLNLSVNVNFQESDILETPAVSNGSVEFVFFNIDTLSFACSEIV